MRYSLLSLSCFACLATAEQPVEVIRVTSDYRDAELAQLPTSASVLDESLLSQQVGQHFEDVLHNIPNLNWSGSSSRPRYFQIRGVGEQEEYEGAPNSSVGFVVDDIDLSGLGSVASTYDLQQIEVLRGPQSTRLGANAIAGMIYLQSKDPTDVFESGVQTRVGEDDLVDLAGYVSGPISDSLSYRLSVQQLKQDGFRNNHYLNREDTNERDELSARFKLLWQPSDTLSAKLTLMHADFDNGYDVWTLDNNGFNTLTDQPGEDSQKTQAGSLKVEWLMLPEAQLTWLTSYADTDHRHAYDGDWANPEYWASKQCVDYYDENGNGQFDDLIPCQYDYLWDKKGDRQQLTQEIRISSTEAGRLFNGSTDWLFGLYYGGLDENNDLESYYNGFADVFLKSDYESDSYAVFGQLDTTFAQDWLLSTGLRFEKRSADYSDDAGESHDPEEDMWGGHISLSYNYAPYQQVYGRIARGYKAGGFNTALPQTLSQFKEFDSETMYNYELGLRNSWLNGAVQSNLAVFYMDRQDQQVEASQQDPDNPQRFFLYTANAASSTSYGLEWDGQWQLNQNWQVYGSLGLLDAEYDDYAFVSSDGSSLDLSDRELAHAPSYQYTLGLQWNADQGWFAGADLHGSDSFYYSDSHDSESDTYSVLNAQLGYRADAWSVSLWGRNIFDKEYGVRGFYFGNEPDQDWAPKQYVRYGDPSQFGLTFNYDFM